MKSKKIIMVIGIVCLLISFSGIQALAHAMFIEPLEDEKIQVSYDGGGFSRRTEVVVLDTLGNELERGRLDSDGIFSYKGIDKAHKIAVDDGLGHRAEWVIGTDVSQLPKIPIVGGMLFVSGGIAWYFDRRTKKKKFE